MIVLDTNALSELLRQRPAEAVQGWLAARPLASLFTTTVTEAEMLSASPCCQRANAGQRCTRR